MNPRATDLDTIQANILRVLNTFKNASNVLRAFYDPAWLKGSIPCAAWASSPEAGAQCGNPARWDLCGGPGATRVPTATAIEITFILGIVARRLFSQVLVSRGSVMRYGCYNSRAPALLTGGVVAGPGACLLVASSRFADASFALHLNAVGRAVALPAVAASADDH